MSRKRYLSRALVNVVFAFWFALSGAAFGQTSPAAPPKLESFALIVGVDAYAKPLPGQPPIDVLKGPSTDIDTIKSLLISNNFKFKNDA